MWGTLIRALPWLLGAGYLSLIAGLGLSFQSIDPWKVDQIEVVGSQPSDRMQPLGLVRVTQEGPSRWPLALEFERPATDEPLAVFLPRLTSNAQVSLNGQSVFQPPVSFRANYQYQPLLIPLPEVLLRPGLNRLDIDLRGEGPVAVLSVFYLGPRAPLERTFQVFDAFRQTLVTSALAVTVLLAVFMATIWLARRRFSEYGWLALAFAAFSYYLASFVGFRQSPLDALYDWSFLAARALFAWSLVCFMHRFLKIRRRWLERLLAGFYLVVFGAGLVLVSSDRYLTFIMLTYFTSLPMVLLVISYLCLILALALLRTGHVYLHWLLVGGLMGLVLGVHDVLVLVDYQHWLVRDFYISHYAIVFIAVGYGAVLVHRVAHALFTSEDLNLELNRQLEAKAAELEQVHHSQVEQERRLALYAERQRLMSDMHDGIGGQLVNLIAAQKGGRLDRSAVEQALEALLADLRLVLDALSPAGEDALDALARLVERYRPLLARADIALDWQPGADVEGWPLPPSQTLQVLRLTQEAVQNAVKHARPGQIRITLRRQAGVRHLTVDDDGCGMPTAAGSGHGMQTMRERAAVLGGTLSMGPSNLGGLQVALTVPDPPPKNWGGADLTADAD